MAIRTAAKVSDAPCLSYEGKGKAEQGFVKREDEELETCMGKVIPGRISTGGKEKGTQLERKINSYVYTVLPRCNQSIVVSTYSD